MSRLYPRTRPALEGFPTVEDRRTEPAWSVNEHARQEARDAANHDRVRYVRGVDEWDVPDGGDL